MPATKRLKVSVKKLVEFSCRQGDLTHEGPAGPSADEGRKAHKKLQSRLLPEQQAEVKVTSDVTVDNTTLAISGRVDLYQSTPEQLTLGEIKSCYAPVEKIPLSTQSLHWAQLKVYGYCVLATDKTDRQSIVLQLQWTNVITDQLTIDEQHYTLAELSTFTHDAAARYITWITTLGTLQSRSRKTAQALAFPHTSFRTGQREMAGAIYVTARDRRTLLCEAPTGIGKTISALFPAAKALGENLVEGAVYLTAKTSGRQSANDALSLLKENGLFITAVTITSKKTTCHCTNGTCERNSDGRCPLTIGFFDRLPDARTELIQRGIITPEDIDEAATKHQLCPFELTLQLLPWVSLAICDFNYVFDPLVRLTHFSESAGKKLLLVDESHNLIDRARAMYSAQLDRQQMLQAASQGNHAFLQQAFTSVARALQRVAKTSDQIEFAQDTVPATVTKAVEKCITALSDTVDSQVPLTEAQAEAAKELYRYIVIQELFGDHHRMVFTRSTPGSGKYTLRLQCLNATDKLSSSFKSFKASAVFSATLRPHTYFRDSLGLPGHTPCMSLPSPFAADQQGTFLCDWVDTRYRVRQTATEPLVSLAFNVFQSRPGNYQMFFPSYAFMESVHAAFIKKHPDVPTIIQQRGSNDEQRHEFLSQFSSHRQLIAFSIMGGIYGEGVDYVGDKLIGTIIVGTGLSSINLQQQLIEQDFARQGLNSFDYASRYPGFTRVLQTAGRVIRTERDAGIVVLAERRFTDPFYQPLFPAHWRVQRCSNAEQLQFALHDFWADHFTLS